MGLLPPLQAIGSPLLSPEGLLPMPHMLIEPRRRRLYAAHGLDPYTDKIHYHVYLLSHSVAEDRAIHGNHTQFLFCSQPIEIV